VGDYWIGGFLCCEVGLNSATHKLAKIITVTEPDILWGMSIENESFLIVERQSSMVVSLPTGGETQFSQLLAVGADTRSFDIPFADVCVAADCQ
jgi:hypothetical protein